MHIVVFTSAICVLIGVIVSTIFAVKASKTKSEKESDERKE